MAENNDRLTQKLLDLDQQLEFELRSFSDNVSALTEAPERKQYDRFCGHLNYIQELLNEADQLTRDLPLDRNAPDFYQLLKAKGHMQEHAVTYGRLRGGFFKKYRIEDERDHDLERVLEPEEVHPEIEELLPENPEEPTEEEAFLLEQEMLAAQAAEEADAEALAKAKKKAKAKADQRRIEEVQRRQRLEDLAKDDAERLKQSQSEHYRQMDEQEALLRSQQEAQISSDQETTQTQAPLYTPSEFAPDADMPQPSDNRSATPLESDSAPPPENHPDTHQVQSASAQENQAFARTTQQDAAAPYIDKTQETPSVPAPENRPDHQTEYPAAPASFPEQQISNTVLQSAADSSSLNQTAYDDQTSLQQDRWQEANRLGIRQDPRKEISEAELYAERIRQEEDARNAEQAAAERRAHNEDVQERFHQRQEAAEQHVRLEKGHVDFSHDLGGITPEEPSAPEDKTGFTAPEETKASPVPESPGERKPQHGVSPVFQENAAVSTNSADRDVSPQSTDFPRQQAENGQEMHSSYHKQDVPDQHRPDPEHTRPASPYHQHETNVQEHTSAVVPPLSPPEEPRTASVVHREDTGKPEPDTVSHLSQTVIPTDAAKGSVDHDALPPNFNAQENQTPSSVHPQDVKGEQADPYKKERTEQASWRERSEVEPKPIKADPLPLSHSEEKPSSVGTHTQQDVSHSSSAPRTIPDTRSSDQPTQKGERSLPEGEGGRREIPSGSDTTHPGSAPHAQKDVAAPSPEAQAPKHVSRRFKLERQVQPDGQRYQILQGSSVFKDRGQTVHARSQETPVYRSTPFGVREDPQYTPDFQPSRNNAQIYSKIKRSMARAGEETPVSISSAYLSSMAWNVHMARIDYQGKKDTPEAVQAAHAYQKQRKALESLKADVRAGRILVEHPKPAESKDGTLKTPKAPGPVSSHQTQYHSTPFGVTGTNIGPDGQVTGSFRIQNKDVRQRFRYTQDQPLKVSPKYEAAMQERLANATSALDTALKLKTSIPPKISFSMQQELRLAQDAYAAFKQAKQNGVVVVSDQSQLDKPNFHNWQQRKQANIFGTTIQPKAFDPTAPKKSEVSTKSASILSKKSKLRANPFYSYYLRTFGQTTTTYAYRMPRILSRNMYSMLQSGEDNAVRTFENGRYYAITAANVASAMTHLHVVAPSRFVRKMNAQEVHQFAKYMGMSNKQLAGSINTKKHLARQGKQTILSLRAQQSALERSIEPYTRLGQKITKEDALMLKRLTKQKEKITEKLISAQKDHSALNKELRKQIAYQKFRKETAEEARILKQLKKDNGPFITRGKLRRDIEATQTMARQQMLEKYGKKLVGYSDKAVKQEIKLLTKQGQVLKSQIKAMQAKGSALTNAQRSALKDLMDKHQQLSKRLRKLVGLDTARNALEAELKIKRRLLTQMHKNANAFYSAMFAFKHFAIRPMREGAENGVRGFAGGINIMTNRHVHLMLRKTFKVAIRMAPGTVAFLATGDIHTATAAATYLERATKKAVVKTRTLAKKATKKTVKLAAKGTKKAVSAITPKPVKRGVHYAAKAVRGRFHAVSALKQKLSRKFWASKVGRGLSTLTEFGGNAMRFAKAAINIVKSVAVKVIAGFILLFILCGIIASMAGAPAGGAASSMILSPYEGAEGEIDLSPYVDILNECQAKYDERIENTRVAYLEQYDKVTIVPAIPDNNMREILSMMAVRCSQDLELTNAMVERYLKSIFEDSHFFTSEASAYYSCSGCKTRLVNKGHSSSCPDPCNSIHTEREEYCPGKHQDMTITLHVLFFDEIFTVDSMGNQGHTAVPGQEIGTFKITHYCACKECCGKDPSDPDYGITATGTKATEGRTIAVDPSVIPLGTHVVIDGVEYVAEDTGGAIKGNRIDIYISDHDRAYALGVKNLPVYYPGYEGGSVVETGEWNGWTEDNILWCKNIYNMDWRELYTGIPNVTDVVGNETNLDGVTFIDGDRAGNQAIVDTALAQLGQVGGQPFWSWYGFDSRVEWCATFVSWCANQNGVLGASVPKFASCRGEGVPWFQSHGQWASPDDIVPVAGDIIFFDWEGDGVPNHVGIVVGTDGDKVYTVEGNSSDAVRTKSYNLNSKLIFGYGLPNY